MNQEELEIHYRALRYLESEIMLKISIIKNKYCNGRE